jgi:hypothetical protein
MCDLTPVKLWLAAAIAALLVAIAFIIGAAIVNSSFWQAYNAVWLMAAAALAAFGASLLCGSAKSALATFCACAKGSPACAGPCSNLMGVLTASQTVLGILATDCLWAALQAWIPVVGLVVMLVIIAALIVQLALIISAFAFLSQLDSCQTPIPRPPTGPAGPGAGPSKG